MTPREYRYLGPDGEGIAGLPDAVGAALGSEYCVHLLPSGARMAEVCREHQVSGPTVYAWRDRFLEGGSKALVGDTPTKREALLERENARLRDVVAELTLANDVLKKPRGNGGGWR